MNLLEKLFQKVTRSKAFAINNNSASLAHKDIVKYLDVFANSINNEPFQIQTVASRDYVGLYNNQLFLPEKIFFFKESIYNKRVFQNLILQTLAASYLDIRTVSGAESSTTQRLKFLENSGRVNCLLDEIFCGYKDFQEDLFDKLNISIDPGTGYRRRLYTFWKSVSLLREPRSILADKLIGNVRNQDKVPEFLFLTIPCIEIQMSEHVPAGSTKENYRRRKEKIQNEIEKTYSGINKAVDIDKEKANPVMHSFEKLETADEYRGGRTMDSGDDELNDHSNALDELNLTKVTRGGEATKSVYRTETNVEFEYLKSLRHTELKSNQFYYPEWNFKKNSYMNDHCHLTENPIQLIPGDDKLREELKAKYLTQLNYWRSRIQSLISEPLWQKKLKEGDEIDIDEIIRDYGAILSKKNISARWYMKRKKQFNDIEIVILFDQSQSSDSWICNRRVLDITIESMGLAGILFENLFEAVTVAGVWSSTRHNCSYQVYKNKYETWEEFFKNIKTIQAIGYTRLGPAIRHATKYLEKSVHKKKLILLITDGKPTDVDGYEGFAGVNDIAQACREAQLKGVLHYALILESRPKFHFAKMFRHYSLLTDPKYFSEELFKILLKLISKDDL